MKDWQYKKEIKKMKELARKRGWQVKEEHIRVPLPSSGKKK